MRDSAVPVPAILRWAALVLVVTLSGLMFLTVPAGATDQDLGEPGVLSAERVHLRWGLDELYFSPDGKKLAFTATGPNEGIRLQSDIWVMDVDSKELRQYTRSRSSDRHPRWSPDGKTLAFLSSRAGSNQIYLLPMDGGEPQLLAKAETGVMQFEWSPDGTKIAFVAPGARRQEGDHSDIVRLLGTFFYSGREDSQLWVADLGTRTVKQLTHRPWRISHFYWAPNITWAPDSEHVLISATNDPEPEFLTSRVYSVALSNGAMREVAHPLGGFAKLSVSPDGSTLAYLGPREDGFEYDDLFLKSLSGGPRRNLTHASIDRRVWAYDWSGDGRLTLLALEGFRAAFYTCDPQGEVEKLAGFDVPPSGHYGYKQPFAAKGPMLAFVGETTTQAPELWFSTEPGKAEKVSHFNREWDQIPVVPLEIVEYDSFDGTKIEAGMLRPVGRDDPGPAPWVILLHGGPSAKWSDRFHNWGEMLATRGIGVLYPNVRGSTGYGYDFLVANRYDWGGGDYKDVMAGVDMLVERGLADPERLGVGGWSYGGYLSTWTITQTNRFKASVSGAPITDMVSEYGTQDRWMNFYDTWYMGNPYDNHDRFVERSPLTHVQNVTTNALLMVGEKDDNGPLGQCLEFYRGLIRHGANAEVAIFPGAGHFPSAAAQQIEVHRRFVEWFVRHLKP